MGGSVRKIDDGLFEIRWDLPPDPHSGKRRTKSKRFRGGIRQAQKELAQILASVDDVQARTSDSSFESVATEWLELKSLSLKPTTLQEYKRRLERDILPALGALPVSKVTAREIDKFYRTFLETHKGSDLSHTHAIVRGILNQAYKWGWVAINEALRATVPKSHKASINIASPAALVNIISAASFGVSILSSMNYILTHMSVRVNSNTVIYRNLLNLLVCVSSRQFT